MRSNLCLSGATSDSDLLSIATDLGIDRIARDNPRSLDLEIGEGGEGLSVGQRQLVGLGRLFLARPKIWILDEPTASLDRDSEDRVIAALAKYVRPKDVLIISTHRPMQLLSLVNRMIVMQQGQVLMDGTPESVIARLRGGAPAQTGQKSQTIATGELRAIGRPSDRKGPSDVI